MHKLDQPKQGNSHPIRTPLVSRLFITSLVMKGDRGVAISTIGRNFELPIRRHDGSKKIDWNDMEQSEKIKFATLLCFIYRCFPGDVPTSLAYYLTKEDKSRIVSAILAYKPHLDELFGSIPEPKDRASLVGFYFALNNRSLQTRIEAFSRFLDFKMQDNEVMRARLGIIADAYPRETDPQLVVWMADVVDILQFNQRNISIKSQLISAVTGAINAATTAFTSRIDD